jgi:hypothetical protein
MVERAVRRKPAAQVLEREGIGVIITDNGDGGR